MHWKHRLTFVFSTLLCIVSAFLIVMHFRHGPYWPANRMGGTVGALALIPVCLLSYGVSCFYVYRWLRPTAFPSLRKILPAPAHESPPQPRKSARTIVLSTLTGMLSGAIVLLHFSQRAGVKNLFGSTAAAMFCVVICVASFSRCVYFVDQWLRTRDNPLRDRADRTV